MHAPIFTIWKKVLSIRLAKRCFFFSVFFVLFFQAPSPVYAHRAGKNNSFRSPPTSLSLPSKYGKIIYRYNEQSSKILYIVGISHRDSISRQNGVKTVKTQCEVYKIGKWLNRHRGLNLLLPEGFFDTVTSISSSRPSVGSPLPDDLSLEKSLADNSRFINAEMLLMQHLHMLACQVEDQKLYDAVFDKLAKLEDAYTDPLDHLHLERQITCLQEERTATILQNIPSVIKAEFHKGAITTEKALFTIGLNHIPTILKYLKDDKLHIDNPASPGPSHNTHFADLNLKDKGFGIVIIIPHTLIQDKDVLKATNLIGLI
jgi:hypothetical protein